ncbi:L-aspartate oxidase [Aquimonas voraii]|uniref:L-aspartate oxidase n=1 Tax=Aquimonas voraii TaxID=265719 RepID=A0A1G7A7A7_9GAMM|nr:L-aspartate oxidase [Aquimonas voraii]SDE09935.1 L-aspartate oxidase [Aquimonas voraii]
MRAEVLIVGSGIAAQSAALAAAPRRVLILTPGRLGLDGASHWAQGGIAAAIGAGDSAEAHAQDTLAAGVFHNDTERVHALTAAAPELIDWLAAIGARFDRDAAGALSLGREAAHSARRIVHAQGDATGAEVMRALAAAVRRASHIEVLQGFEARALLQSESTVAGALAEDRSGRRYALTAGAVVLATGGIGQLYRYTTNPAHADGSGLAMALEVGAELRDLEFVQFHPTALAVRGLDPAPLPLLTEALRGAGAVLLDHAGRRFLADTPGAELAPRDVVARAVYRQLRQGPVWLDAREAVGAAFPDRFPAVFALALQHGLDPRTEALPVAPAEHYHMGGIAVDVAGQSNIKGLFAIGECACTGVHGANRLASNSLLEGLAFGRRTGRSLAACELPAIRPWRAPALAAEPADADALSLRLRHLLWDHAGIERDAQGLATAAEWLRENLRASPAGSRIHARFRVAQALVQAAQARPLSLGAHCRVDGTALIEAGARRQRA